MTPQIPTFIIPLAETNQQRIHKLIQTICIQLHVHMIIHQNNSCNHSFIFKCRGLAALQKFDKIVFTVKNIIPIASPYPYVEESTLTPFIRSSGHIKLLVKIINLHYQETTDKINDK
jgi:hypothetical protein